MADTIAFPVPYELSPLWFEAPDERMPGFGAAFAAVSLAIQTALRDLLPPAFLSGPQRLHDTRATYPLVVYACSRPWVGPTRCDLFCDVVDEAAMRRFFRIANEPLLAYFETLQGRCAVSPELYAPAVARKLVASVRDTACLRKPLDLLLVNEATLLNHLIALVRSGGRTSTPKARAKAESAFRLRWGQTFRRLYANTDFSALAVPVLDAATAALATVLPTINNRIESSAACIS